MTFSILTYDEKSGIYAGAAATGSLCVGGWVLRGDIDSGLVATQGTAPSSFWRDDALRLMHGGASAQSAIDKVTRKDTGRGHRQMIALDKAGTTAGFTGDQSIAFAADSCAPNLAVAGNMLASNDVLEAMKHAAARPFPSPAARMMAALNAADQAGSDMRGLQSAALLILAPNAPPVDLRIDYSEAPLEALAALLARVQTAPYADWLTQVPTRIDPQRAP
ncbi:MAG: DUF1028 domain-containing protein [Paracoccaceae bacterium]